MMTDLLTAEGYFAGVFNKAPWENATDEQRLVALTQANRAINKLAFRSRRLDESQADAFPRVSWLSIPEDIQNAIHEEALAILDGRDIEIEKQNLSTITQMFAGVKQQFDRQAYQMDNILAGILSATAWEHLVPYLKDPQSGRILRS